MLSCPGLGRVNTTCNTVTRLMAGSCVFFVGNYNLTGNFTPFFIAGVSLFKEVRACCDFLLSFYWSFVPFLLARVPLFFQKREQGGLLIKDKSNCYSFIFNPPVVPLFQGGGRTMSLLNTLIGNFAPFFIRRCPPFFSKGGTRGITF
jgi:hypothetical protein